MRKWLRDRPWIWFVLLFVSFVCAWAALITIAVRHAPATVPPAKPAPAHDS